MNLQLLSCNHTIEAITDGPQQVVLGHQCRA